jgi:hypothetical protein
MKVFVFHKKELFRRTRHMLWMFYLELHRTATSLIFYVGVAYSFIFSFYSSALIVLSWGM